MKFKFEKVFFSIFLALTPPVFFTALSVVIWYFVSRNEDFAPWFALSGAIIGVIIDIIFLKKLIEQRYELPIYIPLTMFVFINMLIFGMFMGFPGFNLLTAPLMGYYVGMRNRDQNLDQSEKDHLLTIIPFSSAFIMLSLCAVSIILVLGNSSTTLEIQHMFNLQHEITYSLLIIVSLIGSFILIFLQYLLTRLALKKALNDRSHK